MEQSIKIVGEESKKYKEGNSSLILFDDYLFVHPLDIEREHWYKIKKSRPTIRPYNRTTSNFYMPMSLGIILQCDELSKREKCKYLRLFETSIDKHLFANFIKALRLYIIERADIFEAALASAGDYPLYGLCKFYSKKEEIDYRTKYLDGDFTIDSIFYDTDLEEDILEEDLSDCENSSCDWDGGNFI